MKYANVSCALVIYVNVEKGHIFICRRGRLIAFFYLSFAASPPRIHRIQYENIQNIDKESYEMKKVKYLRLKIVGVGIARSLPMI